MLSFKYKIIVMITIIEKEGKRDMRYSKQREALLQLLRSTKTHPDAESLYLNLKTDHPNISLGTVYRNLKQLAEMGEILEFNVGAVSHFDGDTSLHYHLVCEDCKKIYDIQKEDVSVTVKNGEGFWVSGVDLLLNGLCPNCQNLGLK